jgi:hypothetical protein
MALMFPVAGRWLDAVRLRGRIARAGTLRYLLHGPDPKGDYLPGPVLREGKVTLSNRGDGCVSLPLSVATVPGFHWLVVRRNGVLAPEMTLERWPGITSFLKGPQVGTDYNWRNDFSPWGWPLQANPVFAVLPEQESYRPDSVVNGFSRPFRGPNLWMSGKGFPQWLELAFDRPRRISLVQLRFDTDLDQGYANLRHCHESNVMPTCVRDYRLCARAGRGWKTLCVVRGNYQRLREHRVRAASDRLRLEVLASNGDARARVYEVRVY